MVKKIKHNDLLPWFLEDHGKLPAGYLKSVEKFLISYKLQAASRKRQASSVKRSVDQHSLNVVPVVLGRARCFAVIG